MTERTVSSSSITSVTKGGRMAGGTVRSDSRPIIIISSMAGSIMKSSTAGCATEANNASTCTYMFSNTRSLRSTASSRINELTFKVIQGR